MSNQARRDLEEAFGRANPEHYAWTTSHAVVGPCERLLVQQAFLPLGTRVLDLGCGEGATLLHLGGPEGAVGVELFPSKLRFARAALPSCRFVTASVEALPFAAGSFDHILVRDLIHHLEQPAVLVDELARVLKPGGRVDVLEPSRSNPLILLHALANRVERGELRSTAGYLTRLLERRLRVGQVERLQALPLHRLVFHPKVGLPRLAQRPGARFVVERLERLAAQVLPPPLWAYVHLRAWSRAPTS